MSDAWTENTEANALSQSGRVRADLHTYDKAAKKWDNFDVEAALAELSDDDVQAGNHSTHEIARRLGPAEWYRRPLKQVF